MYRLNVTWSTLGGVVSFCAVFIMQLCYKRSFVFTHENKSCENFYLYTIWMGRRHYVRHNSCSMAQHTMAQQCWHRVTCSKLHFRVNYFAPDLYVISTSLFVPARILSVLLFVILTHMNGVVSKYCLIKIINRYELFYKVACHMFAYYYCVSCQSPCW